MTSAVVQLRDCRVEVESTTRLGGPGATSLCGKPYVWVRINGAQWRRSPADGVREAVAWLGACLDRAGVEEWLSW